MDVVVREATVDDGPALAKLRWEWSAEDARRVPYERFERDFVAFWTREHADGRWHAFVGEVSGRVVSTVWVYVVPKVPWAYPHPATMGYVTNVYTDPALRNGDVGSAVIAHVVEWARASGMEGLYVSPSDRSVPFYERAGFRWSEQWMETLYE